MIEITPQKVTVAVVQMAEAGIRWIQIRLKSCSDRVLYHVVEQCVRRLDGAATHLWVDDRADVAALFPSVNVHVGQRDLPPWAARRVLNDGQWVGFSCHSEQQVVQAQKDSAVDVVACGPVFGTTGKKNPDPVIGLAGVRSARDCTTKPLVAIGGVTLENAEQVLEAGADTVAVLGALCRGDVGHNSRRWMALEDAR